MRQIQFGLFCCILGWIGAATYSSLRSAVASTPLQPYTMRGYYLTKNRVQGNAASTACGPGYHMASMWEILNPSTLKYDTTLGAAEDDSGSGPPSANRIGVGWMRGGSRSSGAAIEGLSNCLVWTDNSSNHYGTAAGLPGDLSTKTTASPVYPWVPAGNPANGGAIACSTAIAVWCVQN